MSRVALGLWGDGAHATINKGRARGPGLVDVAI